MRTLLIVMLAAFAAITQGGTIDSGGFSMSGRVASATVSGQNFTATITDDDVGPFNYNNFPPFQAVIPNLTWGGVTGGVDYNGIFYGSVGFVPTPVGPYSLATFGEVLTSPLPTITGPGSYPLTFSVQLSFFLFDSSHVMFHSETDTGFATGFISYSTDSTGRYDPSFLFEDGVNATIVPEPSTLTLACIAFAVGCLGATFRNRSRS